MRRLLALNLLIALLAPWIAVVSGTAVPATPCPMHRTAMGSMAPSEDPKQSGHHEHANKGAGSPHGTTAHGCNCTGECGRSSAPLSLTATRHTQALLAIIAGEAKGAVIERATGAVDRLLPFTTGPPQRLRS